MEPKFSASDDSSFSDSTKNCQPYLKLSDKRIAVYDPVYQSQHAEKRPRLHSDTSEETDVEEQHETDGEDHQEEAYILRLPNELLERIFVLNLHIHTGPDLYHIKDCEHVFSPNTEGVALLLVCHRFYDNAVRVLDRHLTFDFGDDNQNYDLAIQGAEGVARRLQDEAHRSVCRSIWLVDTGSIGPTGNGISSKL
jgi:hypothetical protein